MKKVGLKKKILLPIMLVLTGSVLTVALVVHNNLTRVDADPVFDGITNVINNKTEADETFNIVEVVPDKSMATFGYLIDGQEPDVGLSGLSTICKDDGTGPQARAEYMQSVKEKLSSIVDDSEEANTKPLYYTGYEESYVNPDENDNGSVKEDSEWTKVDLAGGEVIPAGTNGYTMEDVGDGNGDYILDYGYDVATENGIPKGKYYQNVDHYVCMKDENNGGNYDLSFVEANISQGMTAKKYFNQVDEKGNYIHSAYYAKSTHVISSDDDMQKLANSTPNVHVYCKELYGQKDKYKDLGKVKDVIKNGGRNYEVNLYVILEMEYVEPQNISEEKSYFEVKSDSIIFSEKKEGAYGAVLDNSNPYKKVDDKNATLGYFNKNTDKEVYTYVGNNSGNYKLLKSDSENLNHDLLVKSIFIKGGLKNRDWFRKNVFNGNEKIKFNVSVITPSELNNMSVGSIDLLYISASGLDGRTQIGFNSLDDVDENIANLILSQIRDNNKRLPVIVDSSIADKIINYYYNTPNIGKLAAILCSINNYNTTKINDIQLKNVNNVNNVVKYDFNTYNNGVIYQNSYVLSDTQKKSFISDFMNSLIVNSENISYKQFKAEADKIGFGEIADYINEQNIQLKRENKDLFKKNINKSVILSYIIAYASKKDIEISPLDSLNILEIEPSTVNKNDLGNQDVLKKSNLQKWLGNGYPGDDKVNIEIVSSAEFIGRIEDLSSYDMIYMGLNTSDLNIDSNTKTTVYNDKNMNGLIYSNIGDIVVVDPSKYGHAGLLDSDYLDGANRTSLNRALPTKDANGNYTSDVNTYRGSGNDITKDKAKALKKYLDSGRPIVFGYGFFNNDVDLTVNDYYIDNSSHIYNFLNENRNRDNAIAVDSSGNTYDLYTYLASDKPKLNVKEQKKDNGKAYVELDGNTISVDFTAENYGPKANQEAKFNVNFYIDDNIDGKFSTETEQVATGDFKLYRNGQIVNPVIDANGISSYEIGAGTDEYKLTYDLPEGYIGISEWKLTVSQIGNPNRYDYDTGFVHLGVKKGEEKKKIKLLQINTSNQNLLNLENAMKPVNTNPDVKDEQGGSISHFGEFAMNLTDYELVIKTVTADSQELIDMCSKRQLEDYDIILMGYGAPYTIKNVLYSKNENKGVLDAIQDYIDDGKQIIITHDTTSYYNYDDKNNSNVWGLDFNKILRDEVGMDRYGVSTQLVDETQYDTAYIPKSGKKETARQIQGFTYVDLTRAQNNSSNDLRLYSGTWSNIGGTSDRAVKLNEGQITMYPYDISYDGGDTTSMRPAHTYGGCYQLNLEQDNDNDGETDLVVWYTLDGRNDIKLEYGKSEDDARNNYYVYTMNNITYVGSGVPQEGIDDKKVGFQSDYDLKILINTIISAYNKSAHAPSMLLKEKYDRDSSDVSVLYSSIDNVIDQQLEDEDSTQDVYFTVTDTNNLPNQTDKKITTEFYVECSEGEASRQYNSMYLKKVDWDIWTLKNDGTDDRKWQSLNSDNTWNFFDNDRTYKLKVPMSALGNNNSIKVYAIAHTTITREKNGKTSYVNTPEICKTFNVQRIGLADLD